MMTQPENICPDMSSVTPMSNLDYPLPNDVNGALDEAREYIKFYDWVSAIKAEFLGVGVDGILYLFLFEIIPTDADADSWIWVLVGDVPPAYITCDKAKNPYEAIDAYIGAMEEWVQAAQAGSSVANLIPVNVPATSDNAAILNRRLKFIDERILTSLK